MEIAGHMDTFVLAAHSYAYIHPIPHWVTPLLLISLSSHCSNTPFSREEETGRFSMFVGDWEFQIKNEDQVSVCFFCFHLAFFSLSYSLKFFSGSVMEFGTNSD
uniref:Uncharacterized protein n=1 Tax=Brassica oleracea TaxID=3712 RepID=A0A3P6DJ30_BRAOL|nr:unnamed protein product [Brassica oleracea]